MKKSILFATVALMAAGFSGQAAAAPTLQTCAPMEVTHSGAVGLSYNLSCEAGGWKLNYAGSVPAGTAAVAAQYRLNASHADGRSFTHNRSVRLPSPAMLGQALAREAVQLDSGDIALRDCPDYSCTLYRPLGSKGKASASTVTVTPEVKRLQDERLRLSENLAQRDKDLEAQTALAASLKTELDALKVVLESTQTRLAETHLELLTLKDTAAQEQASSVTAAADAQNKAVADAVLKSDAAWAVTVNDLQGMVVDLNNRLNSQDGAYKEALNVLESANTAMYEELESKKSVIEQLKQAPSKDLFDFVISDLQAQHSAQITEIKQALPETDFNGILKDLVVPNVTATNGNVVTFDAKPGCVVGKH